MCPYYSLPCWAAENEIAGTWCHVCVSTDLGKKKKWKKKEIKYATCECIFFYECASKYYASCEAIIKQTIEKATFINVREDEE